MAFDTQSTIDDSSTETVTDGGAEQTTTFDVSTTGGNANNNSVGASSAYELSDNVIDDVVKYSRGNIVANEQQAVVTLLGWLTGWFNDPEHYVNNVVIGTTGSGKTHLVKNMQKLIPPKFRYHATSASSKGLIDDDAWNDDDVRVAIMSEWQKLPNDAREYMKSVAGDDGGFTYKRGQGADDDSDGEDGAGAETIEKKPLPYSFTYAQFSMDNEMWTRLFKVYIDETKSVNEATARRHHGHTDIQVDGSYGKQYINDVNDVRTTLTKHIAGMPTDVRTHMPEWVFYAMKPIYDLDRSESKRYTSSIANLIRSSCLANYHTRPTVMIDGHEKYVVKPQDVANILECREVLLGTTHEIETRKFKIIDAIEFATDIGQDAICTIEDIQEYLQSDQSDLSRLGRDHVRELLRELEEAFVVRIHDRYEGSSHGYELLSLQQIGYPKLVGFKSIDYSSDDPFMGIDGNPDQPFEGVIGPIRGQPISKTVTEMRERFGRDETNSLSAVDAMGGSSTDTDSSSSESVYKTELESSTETESDGQQSLVGGDDLYEITDPITATVYDRVVENIEGTTFPVESGHEHVIGVVDVGDELSTTDVTDTLMDADHDLWNQPDKPDHWVTNQSQADAKLETAYGELQDSGVLSYETNETDPSILDNHVRVHLDDVEINV